MQTFLPYPDFWMTARVLDYKRKGKQRVEAWQILRCLRGESKQGWSHHPAVLMWAGYEDALENYAHEVTRAWVAMGYKNNLAFEFHPDAVMPPWLGDERLHRSHMSNLLRKKPEYYRGVFDVPENLPYFWPVRRMIKEKEATNG